MNVLPARCIAVLVLLLHVALGLSCGRKEGAGGRRLVVGFCQVGSESAWRSANTASIREEAARRGIDLRFADAQQKQENQIRALRAFLAQKVDVIAFAPVVETGFEPVLREIREAGIPVILSDRTVRVTDENLFACFLGADFVEEGRRAARFLIEASKGTARIVELEGTPGSAPAIDRKRGFAEEIAGHDGLRIIKSQSGDFNKAKGREVMEAILRSPEGRNLTAVYAHNDDMALGAIQALEAAGMNPGKDVLIVSIDGVRAAFDAIVAGRLNCTVECNPLLGPRIFDLAEALAAGRTVSKRVVVEEGVFTAAEAATALPGRKY